MNEPHVRVTKTIYQQLDNARLFRFSSIKEIEDSFISEFDDKEQNSNVLNNYITVLYYAGKTLVFSQA